MLRSSNLKQCLFYRWLRILGACRNIYIITQYNILFEGLGSNGRNVDVVIQVTLFASGRFHAVKYLIVIGRIVALNAVIV